MDEVLFEQIEKENKFLYDKLVNILTAYPELFQNEKVQEIFDLIEENKTLQ